MSFSHILPAMSEYLEVEYSCMERGRGKVGQGRRGDLLNIMQNLSTALPRQPAPPTDSDLCHVHTTGCLSFLNFAWNPPAGAPCLAFRGAVV